MTNKKQILAESELERILALPKVKLNNIFFRFNRHDETIDVDITFDRIVITFFNVKDIKVTDSLHYYNFENYCFISISDISKFQMEKINWEFDEYENGSLHFYCESIFVETEDTSPND